jgi:hypothetical protein
MKINQDLRVIGVAMLYAKDVGFASPPPPIVDASGELDGEAESASLAEWLDRVLIHAEMHPSEHARQLGAAIVQILNTPEAA